MYHQFDEKTSGSMRKKLKHDIDRSIALIMFYENRKSLIFKMLGVFVYWFIEKYVCVDYLCLQIEAKFSSLHRGFEGVSFDEPSVIWLPEFY